MATFPVPEAQPEDDELDLAEILAQVLAVEGAEGMLWTDAEGEGFWQYQCLNQFASRIGGGTEEIMKELAARHLPQPD